MHQIPYTYAHMYPYSICFDTICCSSLFNPAELWAKNHHRPFPPPHSSPFYGPEKMWNFPTQPWWPWGLFFMGMGLVANLFIYGVLYGGCCRCWEDGINTIVLPSCDDDASWLSYLFKWVAQPVTSNWLGSQSTVTWPSSITISRPVL